MLERILSFQIDPTSTKPNAVDGAPEVNPGGRRSLFVGLVVSSERSSLVSHEEHTTARKIAEPALSENEQKISDVKALWRSLRPANKYILNERRQQQPHPSASDQTLLDAAALAILLTDPALAKMIQEDVEMSVLYRNIAGDFDLLLGMLASRFNEGV